jgi:hypothetical protein
VITVALEPRRLAATFAGMRSIVCVMVIAMVAPPAWAEDGEDQKAMVDLVAAQVRALAARDGKAFAATLADDGFAILPGAADEGQGAAAIAAVTERWLAGLGKASIKLDQPRYGSTWYDGELVVAPGPRLRITGVLKWESGDKGIIYKIGAVHISEPVDDKLVRAAAAEARLPALPRLKDADKEPSVDGPDKIATFARRVNADPSTVVVGSAAGEHAVGRAAIGKLLATWRSVKLSTGERLVFHDGDRMLLEWIVGHTEATMKVAGKTVKVPYRYLLVLEQPWAVAAEHGEKSQLLAAHFSVATR